MTINTLHIGTVSKLESLLAAVAAGNGFADLIEYEDNTISFTINHGHDKALIIELIESVIRGINLNPDFITEGLNYQNSLIANPDYIMIIDFKVYGADNETID